MFIAQWAIYLSFSLYFSAPLSLSHKCTRNSKVTWARLPLNDGSTRGYINAISDRDKTFPGDLKGGSSAFYQQTTNGNKKNVLTTDQGDGFGQCRPYQASDQHLLFQIHSLELTTFIALVL